MIEQEKIFCSYCKKEASRDANFCCRCGHELQRPKPKRDIKNLKRIVVIKEKSVVEEPKTTNNKAMSDKLPVVLPVKQVAKILSISPTTVRKMIAEGKLEALDMRPIRIRTASLQEFMNKG